MTQRPLLRSRAASTTMPRCLRACGPRAAAAVRPLALLLLLLLLLRVHPQHWPASTCGAGPQLQVAAAPP